MRHRLDHLPAVACVASASAASAACGEGDGDSPPTGETRSVACPQTPPAGNGVTHAIGNVRLPRP